MGGRLTVTAPHGARFDSPPRVKVYPGGAGTFQLEIGRDVYLGRDLTIEVWTSGDSVLSIGEGSGFLNGVRLLLRPGEIVLGPGCVISDGVWLKSDGQITIGEQVLIRQHSAIHCTREVVIGDLVGIAERVSILDSDHPADGSDMHWRSQPLRASPVRLHRNVLVSTGVVIVRGAEIEQNSVVAANAVVTGDSHPPGVLLAGAPATAIRQLAPEEQPVALREP